MKIYLVGGAVRDKLLGVPVKERDWVVVGATVKEMLDKGYRQVGKDFPVFLHPKTNEEYALARIERKIGPGYQGFAFEASTAVTLQDDLRRRDLTINAIAENESGELVDPYHGQADLAAKVLRHVSDAFAEDPVRILRLGRFYARFAQFGFTIAPETVSLMCEMVNAGEVNALVAERVWKELMRALSEPQPEKFFEVLALCGALPILFPDLALQGPGMQALSAAVKISSRPEIRFAALFHTLGTNASISTIRQGVAAICQRYRVPNNYRELALLTVMHYQSAFSATELTAKELLHLFNAFDIFRRSERFDDFLQTCVVLANVYKHDFDIAWLKAAAEVVTSVDPHELIAQGFEGGALGAELKKQREAKLTTWLARGRV